MDENPCPLNSPSLGALVPRPTSLLCDDHAPGEAAGDETDLLALLWQCLVLLAAFCWTALRALHHARQQLVELRLQAHYWRAQHQRAVQREANLVAANQLLQAQIRELERRFYGRKSETGAATKPPTGTTAVTGTKRRRGQQTGSKGHGRRSHEHLPTTDETCTLLDDQQRCPCCGEPFEEIPGSADGDILEVEVRAYRRRYHRQRYRRRCTCAGQPAVLTAPPPDKLLPKSGIGLSVWMLILLRKFMFFQPLYRVLAELRSYGLHLPAGTITDGLQKLVPLLQPLYELLVEHNRGEGHWHCDETRWLVFVKQTDKAGFAWNLWVFAAKESIVFVLDPTRSHAVPERHFGDDAEGIVNVDRYSAYKAMAQVKNGRIILSFCWAHVRRDFLAVLTSWSELADWACSWIDDIATLYQRNDQRLAFRAEPAVRAEAAAAAETAAAAEAEQSLRAHVEHLRKRAEQELAQPNLRQPQRKVLTSLQNHWPGLTVFVEHPEVPLDNNRAERCHRGPVVARKNYYGSGALWSGRLAAMLFSLFQTVQAWGLDVRQWLTAYLAACAAAGGKPPPAPERHLPWNLTPQERDRLRPSSAKPASAKPATAPPPAAPV
jgi:transposase